LLPVGSISQINSIVAVIILYAVKNCQFSD